VNAAVEKALASFVSSARDAFGEDLRSVVLFGSAAEDALRATSDVNVIVVLSTFDPAKGAALHDAVALASAAIRLRPMFLLESEVADAAEAFAVKFADVSRRHRVLFGADPFSGLAPSRAAAVARLRQVLLNVTLRLRADLVRAGDDERELAATAADAAGPLRASAAEVLVLEGRAAPSPRDALREVAGDALASLSRLRETGALGPGEARPLVLRLIEVARDLRARATRLA
jgi:predicted nucleotidyltransferase